MIRIGPTVTKFRTSRVFKIHSNKLTVLKTVDFDIYFFITILE